MAAVQMTASFRYRCPPGTGTPKELMAIFKAISMAVTVSHFTGWFLRRSEITHLSQFFLYSTPEVILF